MLADVPVQAASDGRKDIVRTERIVRLFRNGSHQELRIPRDFELPGNEAILRKEGNRLIVEPMSRPSLLALLATWAPLGEELPEVDDLEPLEGVDL
jgi:antitoxin VapB